ncbi:phosphotransferase enzyme family protein [Nocardia terpenica]|uniref:Phosphotransferase n=1 Tax=Nocardia terpenica TaxID=455432 RepID=A0A291RQB1_9NOCA|nr:aminoglycoside phosphotransferase family protein [Nocardia terpenica]ATL69663.1 phosphotransferase [Nocardia terpenica]
MTPRRPHRSILASACRRVGLPYADAQLLHVHSTVVYLLESAGVAVRISQSEHRGLRPERAPVIARWLGDRGLPVTEPLFDDAVDVDGATVTFWHYYPQPDRVRPPARELGRLLRQLHALPAPPFALPAYVPLAGLAQVLDCAPEVLCPAERDWLARRMNVLVAQYGRLDSALGVGLVHGDAYRGNLLWSEGGVLLADWDEASIAPRELDLVNIYQGIRFGHTEIDLREFGLAYGYDVRASPAFPTLRAMRDLHTLTSYIRRAAQGDPAATAELRHRLDTLRNPQSSDARWHAA